MIFFCNAEGTINAVVSSPVYQGSNYANEVVFVAPFVPVSVVTVSFIKPNGEYTPAALMTVKELTGIKDEKGNAFNAWTYLVPEAYTEYSGILTAQFKVTNGNTVLATASSSFNVQKGVPNVTPEPPEDIYQQILSALSELKQDVENLENGTTEVGKAKEAEKAEQAEYYTTASGDKSVNTIETQFLNKLDKQTGVPSYPQVYAVEGNTQKLIPVSNGSTIAPNDRIAQYTSRGTLFTQPPETDSDTTNKGYVDGEIKKSNDEQMVINERIVEILDGIEIVKVNDLEYNLMVDETIKGTINIPKDQFLKSVSYDPETHVLTFIFLTSDGEVPTPIDMSSLVDVYQAGNGLTLANNTFSIKLDPSSNNALTLSAAGLMLDNTPLEKAAEDIEILNSDIPKSAKETGVFISGNNTLAGAKAEVSVESKNLSNIPNGTTNIVTVQNGIFTVNGSYTENSAPLSTETFLKAGTYTFSYHYISGSMTAVEGADNEFMVRLGNRNYYSKWGYFYRDINNYNQDFSKTVEVTEDGYGGLYVLFGPTTIYNELVCTFQLERGKTATAYTPYLPTGTAVEVQACGENFANENTLITSNEYERTYFQGRECLKFKGTEFKGVTLNFPESLNVVGVNWALDSDTPNKEISFLRLVYTNFSDESKTTYVGQGDVEINNWVDAAKTASPTLFDNIKSLTISGTGNLGTGTFYIQIMANLGDELTPYTPYTGAAYQSEVGQTIEVEQYDRITNIFSNTAGAAVSTQFLQSTRYELETKPVSLAGTYAERPTGTYPYVMLYTATDTGRTYRLERDTDGSVSSNWVNISSAGGTGGGFTPRGEWNSTTTYSENDLVSLNGSSYVCIEENTNATPASNPDKWMVNAEKGATGATGATGTTGPAGTDGHSVYTATDTCSAEVGVECEVYKDSTNAKGVGDVIINASGRVFTVTGEDVHEGKPTWAGPVTAIINGPQGPAGANGTNGKDYLIYIGDTLTGTSGPNNYSGIIPVDDFNRVPATDEYFTALYKQTLTSGSQLSYCLLQVATASDSGALCQVVKAELLNAPKYIHHIRYTNGSDIVYFTYINDSSDNYTATNDMYLLTTELANKQLDAKERSLMANGIVGGKTIIAVYGEADGVIWGVPTSGEDVAFTKANCKIDDLTIKL